MKYEIIDNVSRFVKRFGMIMDPETMNRAKAEAEEYDFRKISEGHHAVIHGKKMYVIIERDGEIGCSCDDMTYNRMDGAVCKHIIAFSRLVTPITKEVDNLYEAHMVNVCGWTGRELHPEETQIPPDPDLDLGVDDPLHQTPKKHKPRQVTQEEPEKPEVYEEKKMEKKPAWNEEAWNNATQGSFVAYDEAGVAMVLFTDNDFEIGTKPDKWGRTSYEFAVIQNNKAVVLSVGSIRLMNALREILPLESKIVKILRTGEGTGTKYEVQEVI